MKTDAFRAVAFVVLITMCLVCGCGTGHRAINETAVPSAPVNKIVPADVTLGNGDAQDFQISTDENTNADFRWSVDGANGGSEALGTVSTAGVYRVLADVASSLTINTVESTADPTQQARAAVRLAPRQKAVSVSIAPASATVAVGSQLQLSARVNGTSNTGLVWEVDGLTAGDPQHGSVSGNGLYTAPSDATEIGSVTVTARSLSAPSAFASAEIVLIQPSTVNQYYVSKAGSDSNSGTQASPWKTIQHAAGVVAAGSTVNVLDGVYYESVMISHSGTATAPIIFRSQNKWGAKIVGTKATTITIAGDYVQIREFDITNEYTGAAARDGIRTTKSHIVVAGNHIHDIQIYSSCDYGAVAVDQGGYSTTYVPSDLQVLNNVMDHIGKIGQCSVLGKKDHGYGIYFAAANSVAMNNIIFDNGAYGINTWHAATNLTIVNNSIFHNGRSGILVGMGDGPWSTGTSCGGHTHDYSKVYNNIVYDNAEMGIREYDSYRGTCVGSHNTYYDNLVYANKNGNVTLYAPHTASGTVAANPAFANYLPTQPWGTGDYHLQFTSPAKNHGTSQSAPTIDFDGGPRPIDSTWDIGAYEWGTTP